MFSSKSCLASGTVICDVCMFVCLFFICLLFCFTRSGDGWVAVAVVVVAVGVVDGRGGRGIIF